jgi:Ca2+-binding EF-hand superfamily protein
VPTATSTPWIPGYNNCADVTGNGRVNFHDVVKVAHAAFFKPWKRKYDVNRDGIVDYWDLVMTVQQLGRRCERD